MRKYSIFHPWIMSFGMPAIYQDVARRWKGIAFWYLFLLTMVLAIPVAMRMSEQA